MRSHDETEILSLRNDPLRDITVRSMSVRADSLDEATRSVEAVIATENAVTVLDMRTWDVIDEVLLMNGCEQVDQVPMLANHDRYSLDSVFGSTRNIRTVNGEMLGRLYFAEGDVDAERAYLKVKQKHLRDVSAGYRSLDYTDIAPNQSGVVQGKTYTAGSRTLRVTTRWQLREVSLVPIGADSKSKIRSEPPSHPTKENHSVNPQLRAYLEKLGLRADATDQQAQEYYAKLNADEKGRADSAAAVVIETQRQEAPPTPPPSAPPPPAGSPEAVRLQVQQEERDRVRQINELAGDDVPRDIVTRALNEGWDITRSSREFLISVRGSRRTPAAQGGGGAPAQHSRSHEADVNIRSLTAGLLLSQGLNPIECRSHDGRRAGTRFTEQETELGERLQRVSAIDIARECVRLDSGRHILDPEEAIRAAFSGSSLSNVFSTNVNARLMAGWDRVGDTTTGWVDEEDVNNFQEQEDISLTGNAALERLPRGDTAKHASASDSHETYKIARYAKQFVIDEQDFIDDRLSAIMRMPDEMGEAARALRPDLVYSLMLQNPNLVADGGAVFNATAVTTGGGHANLGTGALTNDNLKLAISAMVKQRLNRTATNPGQQLTIRPRFIIVPADLEWQARGLTSAAALAKLFADSSDPWYAQLNLLAQEGLRVVPDDRIGAIGVMDPKSKVVRTGLDTNWFLTSGGNKGLRVAYRRGTGRAPQMRSFMLSQGQWGMGWDINMDIGAAFLDYRPWYKSTGAG